MISQTSAPSRGEARRIKGSVNWMKAKATVQKINRHIANKRKDYLQKREYKISNGFVDCR